jgi:hypothetical protein
MTTFLDRLRLAMIGFIQVGLNMSWAEMMRGGIGS